MLHSTNDNEMKKNELILWKLSFIWMKIKLNELLWCKLNWMQLNWIKILKLNSIELNKKNSHGFNKVNVPIKFNLIELNWIESYWIQLGLVEFINKLFSFNSNQIEFNQIMKIWLLKSIMLNLFFLSM
jgi:hypothetical protein